MEAVSEMKIEDILNEGVSAAKAGQDAVAKEIFLRVTRENPAHDLGWFWLASVTDSLQMRLRYLKKALDLNNENVEAAEVLTATKVRFARALITQGTNAAKNGMQELATYFLLHAAEMDPENENCWLALAQLDEPPEDVTDLLQRVLTINPRNGRAIAMLDEIEGAKIVPAAPQTLQEVVVEEPPAAPAPELVLVMESDEFQPPVLSADAPEVSSEKTDLELPQPELPTITALLTERTASHPPVTLPPAPAAPCETTARELSLAEPPALTPSLVIERSTTQPPASLPATAPTTLTMQFTRCPLCDQEFAAACEQCPACGGQIILKNFVSASNDAFNSKFDRRRSLLAVARYSQALTKDPENAQIHYNLGLAYLNLNRPEVAMRCLRRAEQLHPDARLASTIAELAQMQTQGPPVSPALTAPVAPGQTAPNPAVTPTKDQGRVPEKRMGKQKSIMVVDDSPTIRKLVTHTLEKCGYRVTPANDGSDALAKIGEVKPDLVFLDVMMPNLDGYQVCKFIREMRKDLPVVMLSGKDGFFDKVRGKVAGSTAYITKPFETQTLVETARKYCPAE
jgi:CheY-like chemotaxis protein/Tfp pilus assembly protein PilF